MRRQRNETLRHGVETLARQRNETLPGAYLQDSNDLARFEAELRPSRETIKALLEHGTRGRHAKTARFCAGLLGEYGALWTFCEVPSIDLTNTAAERALRHGVILRKIQLGTQSQTEIRE